MTSPDLTTEVIGFRQWRITEDLELRAAHKASQVWAPGENRAVCVPDTDITPATIGILGSVPLRRPCADAPGHDCSCGLYALHDPADFWYGRKSGLFSLAAMVGMYGSDPLVSGVVAAWGAIEVHHQGFRAQYARVVALALPAGKRDAAVARAAAAEYGVPVVEAERLVQVAGEFGAPVPEHLRPEKPKPPAASASLTIPITGTTNQQQLAQLILYGPPSRFFPITSGSITPEQEPAKGPKLPRKGPTYDPRSFLPKRHGGLL